MIASLSPMERAWLAVGLLWFVACLNYLDRVMITTMRASLVDAIPMTDAQFGLLTSVFLWVYALLSPLGGYLADRFSRSRVVLGSLFVWSAITWLTGHAQTFNQLLLARALMGVSEACYLPAALALIMDYHRGSTRSLATGVHMTGVMVGAGLGGLGGWLADRHDWSYAFTLFGMIGVAYAVVLILLLREAPRENVADNHGGGMTDPVRFQDAWVSLFSRSAFILALAFWGLNGLVGWALVGWLPTYLGERFQLSQGAAGLSATGYLQGASLLGVLIGGAWADRWSRSHERGRLFVPAIGFCLAAPAIFLASVTSLLPLAIGGLVLYGVGRAFADSNMMPILCLILNSAVGG
ncbi:MAG TPA: MFS transporter [Candidatus Paceibacterota bacterium]|nr:MFS transporter [Candidatus Paceibacterota bacterium]